MDNIDVPSEMKTEIVNEIARLEAMYKHCKILYRKLMLLCACCSNEIKVVKRNRDLYSPRNDPDPEMIPNPEMIPKSTPK